MIIGYARTSTTEQIGVEQAVVSPAAISIMANPIGYSYQGQIARTD